MDVARLALALAEPLGVSDPEPVERDIRLHLLLAELSEMPSGAELLFKGGTCLAKCYLRYHRFSADLDFTWRDQSAWTGRGTKAGREQLRRVQRPLVQQVNEAARKLDLHFEAPADVRFGRSNRMMTLMLGYEGVAGSQTALKVQVSFEDLSLFAPLGRKAANAFGGPLPPSAAIADPAVVRRYERSIELPVLDPREIAAEKVRALLTRQAAKGRDVLDLFLLERDLGIQVDDLRQGIQAKTAFALTAAARYREHLGKLDERLDAVAAEDLGPLLLRPIDLPAFEAYRRRLLPKLRRMAARLDETKAAKNR